ncbi:hypothetical protein D3C81_2320810 [compost metagenome]
MINVWPACKAAAALSSMSMLPSLLMYCAARTGPRVNRLWNRLCLTTQLAWRTRPIRNTTSISDG